MGDGQTQGVEFTLNGRRHVLNAISVVEAMGGAQPEPLRTHSVRINDTWYPVRQAFEIATGVPRRDFTSHTARRHFAALGFELHGEIKRGRTTAPKTAPPESPSRQIRPGTPEIILVTCVKEKLTEPAPARDLYTSPLFRKERAYAEATQLPWFILSAEYGLVAPNEWLAPYERYLPDTPPSYQNAWGQWVVARLELIAGPLEGRTIEIHAGAAYIDALRRPVAERGAAIFEPLAGLKLGARLAWYGPVEKSDLVTSPEGDGRHASAVEFRVRLNEASAAVAPADFLARGAEGLRVPGLYSWWIDPSGAEHLLVGLGHRVESGLIYAGLAGATRWPSGRRSTNTLWSRIAGMHLGKRHEFSTFRRSLGSILAAVSNASEIDEAALTSWMHEHLRVLAIPFDDADTLGHLEEDVLKALNPPLNLKGMESTPIRRRLRDLRRPHSR